MKKLTTLIPILMSRYIGSIVIFIIFSGVFISDVVLKINAGIKFSSLILSGEYYDIGMYPHIWLQLGKAVSGELWRFFSWMFFANGLIQAIVYGFMLILLCSSLEKSLGTFRFLTVFILGNLLAASVVFVAMYSSAVTWNGLSISILEFGMGANTMLILPFLAGVVLTLSFSNNNTEQPVLKHWQTLVIFLYLITAEGYQILNNIDRFACLNALFIGVLITVFLMRSNSNKFTRGWPGFSVAVFRKYPAIFSIIGLCVIICLIDILTIRPTNLVAAYGDSSFLTWLKCALIGLEDSGVNKASSILLMNTEEVNNGQIWRFATNVFSHYGFLHILINMPVLYFAGKYVEEKIGGIKTILVFIASSIIVSMAWYLSGSNMVNTGE